MTWFRVDDRLHSHRKSVRANVRELGLWVLAGSWCSDQLTDGFIPDYVAARLDPDYIQDAAGLVAVGLWVVDEEGGDRGWRFHQWTEHQPTASSVLEKRAEAKERMRRVRANKERTDVRANTERSSREVRSTPTRPDLSSSYRTTSATGRASRPRTNGSEPTPDPTTNDAKHIAAWWAKKRADDNAPIVMRGTADPIHALANLIGSATNAGYSDTEIRQALTAIDDGIPSSAQLDRALARQRQPKPTKGGVYLNPENHDDYKQSMWA